MGNVDSGIARFNQIAIAGFARKVGEALFVGADRGIDGVPDENLDSG